MRRSGFTLVEVLACLLVLTLGFSAAIALIAYGFHLARMSLARSIGMPTAISVAVDPIQLLPPGSSLSTSAGTTIGWVNGLWIERSEGSDTILASGLRSTLVTVNVFEGSKGKLICSYQERFIKQTYP